MQAIKLDESVVKVFKYVALSFSLLALFFWLVFYAQKKKQLQILNNENDKILLFKKVYLIKTSIIIGVLLFNLILLTQTLEYLSIILSASYFIILLLNFPQMNLLKKSILESKDNKEQSNDLEISFLNKKFMNWGFFIFFTSLLLLSIFIYKLGKNTSKVPEWDKAVVEDMVHNCMKGIYEGTPEMKAHPELVQEYCECSTDTIIKVFTYEEMKQFEEKPQDEQLEVYMPYIQKCFDEFSRKIKPLLGKELNN